MHSEVIKGIGYVCARVLFGILLWNLEVVRMSIRPKAIAQVPPYSYRTAYIPMDFLTTSTVNRRSKCESFKSSWI